MEEIFVRRADARFFLSILAAGLLSFSGVVVETAMNVTFPTLMREFSVDTATVQWITTGYLLVLAVMIPTSSYLKHRFPMKKLFLTACLCFIMGTVLAGIGAAFAMVLGGRLLQGLGTGIALPLMFNIVMEQAPLPRIGTMMGAAMLVTALAPAVGPSLGGYIVFAFGWRMIFWALLPVLVFSAVVGSLAIRQSSETGPRAFDFSGWLLLALAFCGLIFALGRMDQLPDGLVPFLGFLLLFAAALYAFVRHEERMIIGRRQPLLNVRVFMVPAFAASTAVMVLLQAICLGIGFLLPNFAQLTLGDNAFSAGCILLPGCLLGAALAPVSGQIYDRLGARVPLLAGAAAILLSEIGYCLDIGQATILSLTLIYMLFTLGQGLTSGNVLTFGISTLPQALRSDGNAVFNTGTQLAGAVGTSLAAAIVAFSQRGAGSLADATASGTQDAFFLLLAFAILETMFVIFALKGKPAAVVK